MLAGEHPMLRIKAKRDLFAVLAFACAGIFVADSAVADDSRRADAVATMQRLAASIDHAYAGIAPALAVLPPSGRIALEHAIASVDTSLSAYALSDAHDARAQTSALNTGDWDAAVDSIVARAENALTVGNYARCEELAQLLGQLAEDTRSD